MTAGTVLTIGLFDGVHLGHQAVIARVVEEAKRLGRESAVVTFDRHPAAVLRPGSGPLLLTDARLKEELLLAQGIDQVVMIEFTREFAGLTPTDFLEDYIMPLQPDKILVGRDFHFGRRGVGDVTLLEDFAHRRGFQSESLPLLAMDGIKASSSKIREYILAGDINGARAMLGRWPVYRGQVAGGEKRGRLLGFPTANILIPDYICLPAAGVYAGVARAVDIPDTAAVLNIGYAPTFAARATPLLEAHLLDFSQDVYGAELTIEFRAWLRGEERFEDADALGRQIAADARQTRDMLLLTDTERRSEE